MGEVPAEPHGQFAVALPDGLRIERLPVGVAAGHVWLHFVLTGIRFLAGEPDHRGRYPWDMGQHLAFEGPAGRLSAASSGGSGADDVQTLEYAFPAAGLSWIRIAYLDGEVSVAVETLPLGDEVAAG